MVSFWPPSRRAGRPETRAAPPLTPASRPLPPPVDWNAQSPTEAQVRAAESATQAARQRQLLNPQQPASQSLSSPRKNAGSLSAGSSQQQLLAAGKTNQHQQHQQHHQQQQQQQPQQQQQFTQQLQEPFEQIRQVELNARARKSRHAPFYLFTV